MLFFVLAFFPSAQRSRERKRTTKKTSCCCCCSSSSLSRARTKKKENSLFSLPSLLFFLLSSQKKKEKRSRFLAQSKKIYRKRTFEASGGRVDPNKLISFRSVVFAEEKIGESTRHHFVAFASKSTRTRER